MMIAQDIMSQINDADTDGDGYISVGQAFNIITSILAREK